MGEKKGPSHTHTKIITLIRVKKYIISTVLIALAWRFHAVNNNNIIKISKVRKTNYR